MESNKQYTNASLLKTITDWIYENGGNEILADLIISENHEIYTRKAVDADLRLKAKGILSYEDVKPAVVLRNQQYNYAVIEHLYYHYRTDEIAVFINRSRQYVNYAIDKLIKNGVIERYKQQYFSWTEKEDQFIRDNGHKMHTVELGEKLNRTRHAVQQRKYFLGVTLEERYRKLAGRRAHKHFVERR